MAVLTPEQEAFLREHRLAVLGTGRRDGSPQLSTIMYHYDGSDIAISVTSDRAKWKNAVRQPRVAMLVLDGRKQLILYGRAQAIDDAPGIVAGHRRIRQAMGRAVELDDEAFARELQGQLRVILRITPERAFMND
ncbi:MAG: TIGR03618 family F420-dependent PPOX class oxidoreductase [Chloroflexi bacterium]|nr:TIGR03618 family F420-dependent PPOX class oxidoreductase [Chloroflexota bacterium]